MTTINLDTEVMILKEYINWYNTNPAITKEELYRSYYGKYSYQPWLEKENLDKFLTR